MLYYQVDSNRAGERVQWIRPIKTPCLFVPMASTTQQTAIIGQDLNLVGRRQKLIHIYCLSGVERQSKLRTLQEKRAKNVLSAITQKTNKGYYRYPKSRDFLIHIWIHVPDLWISIVTLTNKKQIESCDFPGIVLSQIEDRARNCLINHSVVDGYKQDYPHLHPSDAGSYML